MAQYVRGVAFKGNPRVRKIVEWQFTPEQQLEIAKCMIDPEYFIRTYVKIKHVDEEDLILFQPRSYQVEMLKKMLNHKRVIVKLPRQAGKTVLVSAVLLWHVLFLKNFSILVAAHKADKARDVLAMIKAMFEDLPEFLQLGADEWNKGNIVLENKSRIKATSTSGSAARGDTYNLAYVDEAAFIQSHIAKSFFESVIPTISSGKTTKIFITSTPKGLNHFHIMWEKAVKGLSGYEHVEIKWNEVPGRDEEFRTQVINEFGEDYFNQEYGAEFIGSSRTLIKASKLLGMVVNMVNPVASPGPEFRIYKMPEKGRFYFVTCDVAEGLGGDYSAITVTDITETPYRTAAVYQNNQIDTLALPGVLHDLARAYNMAPVLVESNFGGDVARTLATDLEYENVITTVVNKKGGNAEVGGGQSFRYGVMMNAPTKRIGCTNLKSLIENDQYIVSDSDTIDEARRFAVKKQSYAAEEGNDDLMMTLVLFGWAADQGYVRDMTDVVVKQKILEANKARVEQDMAPFGIIDDGSEELPKFGVPGFEDVLKPEANWLLGIRGPDPEPDPWVQDRLDKMYGDDWFRGSR